MLGAKQETKAIQLLTNLAWVTKKLEVCGPADIIDDYIHFVVDRRVEEEEVSQPIKFLIFSDSIPIAQIKQTQHKKKVLTKTVN